MGLFISEEEEREKRWGAESRERMARHERFAAEAKLRTAELDAARDRSFEIAGRTNFQHQLRILQTAEVG